MKLQEMQAASTACFVCCDNKASANGLGWLRNLNSLAQNTVPITRLTHVKCPDTLLAQQRLSKGLTG